MAKEQSSLLVVQSVGDVYVVEVMDRSLLEQRSIDKLEAELLALAEKVGWPRLVVNFAGIRHISSSTLGAILALNNKVSQLKGELRLAGIDPKIMEVFRITKLDKVLKIFKTTEEALKGFSSPR